MHSHDSASPITRYLGIDLGDKRTGLALGDSHSRMATPIGCVHVPIALHDGRALLEALDSAAIENLGEIRPSTANRSIIVMGLPMHMDGTEGQRAKIARAFAERLNEKTGRTVELFDERLTTAQADWLMSQSGLSHKQKKQRRDAIAAAVILTSYLDAVD